MYVVAAPRAAAGVSKAVLAGLEDAARERGWTTLRLETGPRQPEAIGLYTGAGYRPIEAFGAYVGAPTPRTPSSSSGCSTPAEPRPRGPRPSRGVGAGAADADLGAVGAVGVPDGGAGVAGDGEAALVDGGVVPFAEQRAVLAAGRAAVRPSG